MSTADTSSRALGAPSFSNHQIARLALLARCAEKALETGRKGFTLPLTVPAHKATLSVLVPARSALPLYFP